jgi:DNA-binding transcriptional LysR family regulator
MNLKQISYFMWVFEEGSFSRAAEKANVVQSALSMQVSAIEKEFGVRLFHRLARGVEPTEAAEKFYKRCQSIVTHMAYAHDELSNANHSVDMAGEIRVGLPGSFNRGLLVNVLLPYMEQYPQVKITISEAFTGTLIDWVRDGGVDFALGIRPSEESGLIQKFMYRDRVVLLSRDPINGENYRPCDLSLIKPMKLITPSRNQSFGEIVPDLIRRGKINVLSTIDINGTCGAFEMARRSDWVALSPFLAVYNEWRDGDMYIYPIVEPFVAFELYLVYDKRRPLSQASRHLIATIENEFRKVDEAWLKLVAKHDAHVQA